MLSEENTMHYVFTSGTKQQANVAELNFNLSKIVILRTHAASPELGAPYRTLWVILTPFSECNNGPKL